MIVDVALGMRAYPIHIAPGLLGAAAPVLGPFARNQRLVVVTDESVAALHLETLAAGLPSVAIEPIILPPGEATKDWAHLQLVVERLLELGVERSDAVVALGGGVIGDITGFAAACYMRGVPFVQVPTTLLSQVDSSVGGKTAINHPLGKNMIGAFYQPQRVVCDLDTLQTLPPRELSAGLAEVIKYGPIADMQFLEWLEINLDALMAGDPKALGYAVQRSCEIKASVVSQDERDVGMRAALNFGHTFGHAIEAGLGFGEWLHGEAVGCGMVMASRLSQQLGLVDAAFTERLTHLIAQAGLPVTGPDLGADSIKAGIIASIVAVLAVAGLMIMTYGRFGVYSVIALAINVLMILGIMSAAGFTLTLPGIAGMVLTIGAAVDANVLINERIREERKRGRKVVAAVETGYKEAGRAIYDANATNFISGVALFAFGSGPVKGFAVVLVIGLFTSVFTGVTLTRLWVAGWLRKTRPNDINI